MDQLATYKGLGAFIGGVETLSSASTIVTLTPDQQGKLLLWPGNAGSARILLPAPSAGMVFRILCVDDAVSSATKFVSSGGAVDIYYAHLDKVQTTGRAVSLGTTLEGGGWVEFTGLSGTRWAVTDWGPASSLANTALQTTST